MVRSMHGFLRPAASLFRCPSRTASLFLDVGMLAGVCRLSPAVATRAVAVLGRLRFRLCAPRGVAFLVSAASLPHRAQSSPATFDALGVDQALQQRLRAMNVTSPTDIQSEVRKRRLHAVDSCAPLSPSR